MTASQAEELHGRCELLRSLHRPGAPLLLPNAWDVATARAVVAAGFPVVATTSGGVAPALGYEDHEGAPADEMFAAAARIARGVEVPVTVDAEAGYGMEPAELVDALRSAGAAGCNLEDTDQPARRTSGERTLVPVDVQAERLAAVKQAGRDAGVDIVLNARIDCWVLGLDDRDVLIETSVERGRAYLAAGADCVYPIGAADEDDLRAIVAGVGGPVNVYLRKGIPDLDTLQRIGVARASMGSGLFKIAHGAIADAAARIRQGDLSVLG